MRVQSQLPTCLVFDDLRESFWLALTSLIGRWHERHIDDVTATDAVHTGHVNVSVNTDPPEDLDHGC
jgi:hypothetical protein